MNHKATVAGVAIAVLLMLLAGVGYAAFTASVSSTGNNVGVAYIVLNEGQANAKLIGADSNIDFDTTTDAAGDVTYIAKAGDFNAGNIYIKKTATVSAETCTITITDNSNIIDSTRFTLKVNGASTGVSYSDHVWTVTGVPMTTSSVAQAIVFGVVAEASFTAAEKTTLNGDGVTFNIAASAADNS